MRNNKIYLGSLILIFLAVIFYFLYSPTPHLPENQGEPKVLPSKERLPSYLQFKGTELIQTDAQGNIIFKVSAKAIKVDKSKEEIIFEDSRGGFYDKKEEVFSFSSPLTLFNLKTKDVFFPQGVEGKSIPYQANLRSLEFCFLSQPRKLFGSKKTEFEKENIKISANLLECDLRLEKIEVKGDTRTEIIQ